MLNQIIIQSADVRCGYQLNPELTTESVVCITWILKLLIRFPRMRNQNVLEMLGFDEQSIDNDVIAMLPDLLIQANTVLDEFLQVSPFEQNFAKLMQVLALNDLEQQVFRFVLITSHSEQLFEHVHLPFFMKDSADVFGQIAWCIDANVQDLRNLFECQSALIICNLVRKVSGYHLAEQFESPQVFQRLFSQHCDINTLLAAYSVPVVAPVLNEQDFSFLQRDYDLLRGMLNKALADADVGCNFLIYGPPGTGKTQLARLLATNAALHPHEVSAVSDDKSYDARERIHRYQVCQRMFAKTPRAVLIFDEADDVLPSAAGLKLGNVGQHKQAMNQILETNATPCFWLCNDIDNFDPAQLRRFRHILRLDVPPYDVRIIMAHRFLGHIQLTEKWLEQLAIDERVTPAMLAHIQKYSADFISDSPIENQFLLEQMLNPLLLALNGKSLQISLSTSEIRHDAYNTDVDFKMLLGVLQSGSDIKILLYGPPGTGKTSFATLVANHLKVPLIKAQASNLLFSLVGETEKAIAQLFREASRNKAVLLIDEVDSFLACRMKADMHWQTTMTNEFLAQVDSFEGLLVCTTNAIERIDSAALRRFDLKVKLDFLSYTQCLNLMTALVQDFGIFNHPPLTEICQQLHDVTPSDFNLARRKLKKLTLGCVDFAAIVATFRGSQSHKSVDVLENLPSVH